MLYYGICRIFTYEVVLCVVIRVIPAVVIRAAPARRALTRLRAL